MTQKILFQKQTLSIGISADCGSKKSNRAQSRWRILAKALISPSKLIASDSEVEVSVRRFTSFGLLKNVLLENMSADGNEFSWCEYSTELDDQCINVQIRRINKSFTASELIGFNNTGNVCVWPSEECLGYYLLKNCGLCRKRSVLELGGGMSCLAGVLVAKYCNPSVVMLTDGNVTSIENVRCIIARNDMADFVECAVVQWAQTAKALKQTTTGNGNRVKIPTTNGEEDMSLPQSKLYDVILSADCLFFDDARLDLVETIYGWLADDGIALVMAPRRGTTFQDFAEASIRRGFIARQTEHYDDTVWSRHLELLKYSQEYSPDLHYPVLLELTKQKKTPPG